MFPYCLYCCTGNRCGSIESIERGDQEQEQIELLYMTNQRNSIIETEYEQVTFVRNSEDSKDSEEIKEEEKNSKASDNSDDHDDSDDSHAKNSKETKVEEIKE